MKVFISFRKKVKNVLTLNFWTLLYYVYNKYASFPKKMSEYGQVLKANTQKRPSMEKTSP